MNNIGSMYLREGVVANPVNEQWSIVDSRRIKDGIFQFSHVIWAPGRKNLDKTEYLSIKVVGGELRLEQYWAPDGILRIREVLIVEIIRSDKRLDDILKTKDEPQFLMYTSEDSNIYVGNGKGNFSFVCTLSEDECQTLFGTVFKPFRPKPTEGKLVDVCKMRLQRSEYHLEGTFRCNMKLVPSDYDVKRHVIENSDIMIFGEARLNLDGQPKSIVDLGLNCGIH